VSVFVTDGDQRATLAVVRALGQAGIRVTVGNSSATSLAGSSRYCAERVCYPSPVAQRTEFQSFMLAQVRDGRYRVLLPMTDITMQLVAEMRQQLGLLVRVPIPDPVQIARAQDKREVILTAQRLGIPCPETLMPHEEHDLADCAKKLRYPVVIKPRVSWLLRDGKWVSGNVQFAHSVEDLIEKYHEAHMLIPDPLIQEKIEGEGRGVFLLSWNGELKAAFCHRRLREKPPWGGVSVYRESIPFDADLVRESFDLLQAIEWQGPAMVEFKLDRSDGKAKLMEINGRFWGSLQLAIDAGMNFPLMLYRLANGEEVPSEFNYQVGVKSRWLLGDLDHLLIRLKHADGRNGFSRFPTSKLQASLDFLKLYERNLHYEVFRFKDPGPGWYEWKSYITQLVGRRPPRKEEPGAC
jgi:predicted ATP-grasp superfamily ATP-dependent carboligase